MKDNYIPTAESVTAGHPDKLCDTIADNVLDACLKEDPNARVACEVLATAGKILVAGELRTTASPDVEAIVRQTVRNAGYDCNYHVEVRLHTQSPDIAEAVDGDTLGAGDQGIMYGYACWETVELLPAPVVLLPGRKADLRHWTGRQSAGFCAVCVWCSGTSGYHRDLLPARCGQRP